MLHGVDHTGSVVSVTPDQLSSLVGSIRASGHEVVPLLDLLQGRAPAQSVALTFDDGFESVATVAAPLLADLGAPAALFLTTGYVGRDNQWPGQYADAPAFPMMSWEQVARLAEGGWAIECHTAEHPDLRALDDQALEQELVFPKAQIAERIGRAPSVLAYPYGYFDRRVLDFARRHFAYAVTTKMGALEGGTGDPHQVPRLDAYYLRAPAVHRRFGARRFAAYVGVRGFLRRLKAHPGEIEVEVR